MERTQLRHVIHNGMEWNEHSYHLALDRVLQISVVSTGLRMSKKLVAFDGLRLSLNGRNH